MIGAQISQIGEKKIFVKIFAYGWVGLKILPKIFLSLIWLIFSPIVTHNEMIIGCKFHSNWLYQSSNMAHQMFQPQTFMILPAFTKLTINPDRHIIIAWNSGSEVPTYASTNPELFILIGHLEVSNWMVPIVLLHPVYYFTSNTLYRRVLYRAPPQIQPPGGL